LVRDLELVRDFAFLSPAGTPGEIALDVDDGVGSMPLELGFPELFCFFLVVKTPFHRSEKG
jgi:hypothetical protein